MGSAMTDTFDVIVGGAGSAGWPGSDRAIGPTTAYPCQIGRIHAGGGMPSACDMVENGDDQGMALNRPER